MARPLAYNSSKVLSAAVETFWRHGYSASSVAQLLEATQLNRGSLYNSFGDKRGLYIAALDFYYQRFTGVVLQLLKHSPDPVAGILAVFEMTMIDLPDEHRRKGCLLVNSVAELSDTDTDLAQRALVHLSNVQDGFAQALVRAREQGLWTHPQANPQFAADLLFQYMTGLRISTRFDADPEALREKLRHTLQMLGLTLNTAASQPPQRKIQ